jgi:hypothetical protein
MELVTRRLADWCSRVIVFCADAPSVQKTVTITVIIARIKEILTVFVCMSTINDYICNLAYGLLAQSGREISKNFQYA